MRTAVLVLWLVVGCSKGHEDRHEAQVAPTRLRLAVAIAGDATATAWSDAAFTGTPRVSGHASDGEARDTWSLRELVHHNVGPAARVTAVIGGADRVAIDPAAWGDASRTPILHTTRRGSLKFRWANADGAWGETVVKNVTALEVTR